jgi:hypothetical protein
MTSEVFGHPDGLRLHDLVGLRVLQHPVLVDAASCAKAFRPTIALLYCTGKEVADATSLEARVSMVESIPVS